MGATAEDDDGADDESQASVEQLPPKENCYEIVGTMFDSSQPKPNWVHEVYEVSKVRPTKSITCTCMSFAIVHNTVIFMSIHKSDHSHVKYT